MIRANARPGATFDELTNPPPQLASVGEVKETI